jgi:hypothetical protein
MLRRIAIVGASLAGLRAAETLRARGFDGELTIIGDEPHRPYDRPPLSKQVLQGSMEPEQAFFRRKDGYDALALDMRLGLLPERARGRAEVEQRRDVALPQQDSPEPDRLSLEHGPNAVTPLTVSSRAWRGCYAFTRSKNGGSSSPPIRQ